jgi:MGT family glycosyltransferase
MARIYIMNLGLHGHINPTLGLVQELVAAGDEVTYFAPPEFEKMVSRLGARFEPYYSEFHKGEAPRHDGTQVPMPLRLAKDNAQCTLPLADKVLKGPRPDAILYDVMCLSGRIIAKAARVPHVRLSPSYMVNEKFNVLFPFPQDAATTKTFDDFLAPIFSALDVPPFQMKDLFTYIAPLNISFIPREFQVRGETFDERFIFAGPAFVESASQIEFEKDLLKKRPLLYISLGTVFNSDAAFFNSCIEAFKDEKWHVVMSLGNRLKPELYANAPANFTVRSFVPQTEILQHTDVFLTHGGMNSVQEALYFGVPMAVVPQMYEQSMNAKRVSEIGAGVALDPANITATLLRSTVDQIADNPTYRKNSRTMGEHGREAGGAKRAAAAIHDYLAK